MPIATDTEAEPARLSKSPGTWRRVLLATDGSENASRAADVVNCIASALGAHVTVAAVAVEHGSHIVPWDCEPAEHEVPITVAADWTKPEAVRLRGRGNEVAEIVLEGHPAEALAAAARAHRIDLVVIGHHGTDSGSIQVPGSVAEDLVRCCPCPLLIVP